ncbi:hypothetical protein ACFX13_003913 [Malus domestica]
MESVIPKMGNRKTKEILGEGENSEGSRSDVHLTEKQELGESLAKLQLKPENTGGATRNERPTFGRCAVCLKEDAHWSDKCPYLKHVPDGTTIGPRYGIVCTMCGKIGGHPGRDNWEGRAEEKYCFHCLEDGLHWDKDCPISPYDDTDSQLCKPRQVRVAGVGGCDGPM